MNLITYTILCYSVLGCGGPAFTSAEPIALEEKTDAEVQMSAPELNETPEAAAPIQEAGLLEDGGEDSPDVRAIVDASEEPEPCATGTYRCEGESSFYCNGGVWRDVIDCESPETCVADSRSCVK
jgi:hypothetical protein